MKVNFNLRGRRWENPKTNETKFFVSLDAWSLEKAAQENQAANLPPLPENEPEQVVDGSDDLPF